jgi:hypothetical protein
MTYIQMTSNPWIGRNYGRNRAKILVLGESRYDEEFTDRQIIKARIARKLTGGQQRTYTKFERAVLGQNCSEAEAQRFWNSVIFHNYNVTAFPGGPRVPLTVKQREHPENGKTLRKILKAFRPSHAIVWGLANWRHLDVDPDSVWIDKTIPKTKELCSTTTVDGHPVLFTRISHPSAAFSSKRWASALKHFLELRS